MASIITRAGKGAPLTNNEVDANFTNLNTALNPLRQAIRVAMTAAASGGGISQLYNDNYFLSNTSQVLFFRCAGNWSSATKFYLSNRQVSTGANGSNIVCTSGLLRIEARNTGSGANTAFATSTETIPVIDGYVAFIAFDLDLQSDGSGVVRWYANGAQLGDSVAVTAVQLGYFWQGVTSTHFNRATDGSRVAADFIERGFYNRHLTDAEHLSLCVNGPAIADIGASQTVLTSGTLVLGRRYRIDTYVAGDSFTNVGAGSNASGVEFIATGTTPTTWTNSSSLRRIGVTGQWSAQDAQSDTGQIFDSSGNKNHAILPAAGATIIGKEVSVPKQVRWTNTWAGTNELQYIGGVNQAILPAKAYIESIVGVITGATPHDIIIGDGSDTDRYVTITTGLAAGTTTFTLANRTTDGTNLKLTVDPDTNATMSIAWTITYRTLE